MTFATSMLQLVVLGLSCALYASTPIIKVEIPTASRTMQPQTGKYQAWQQEMKLAKKGQAVLHVKARMTNDLHCGFSPVAETTDPMVEVLAYGWKESSPKQDRGSRSVMRAKAQGPELQRRELLLQNPGSEYEFTYFIDGASRSVVVYEEPSNNPAEGNRSHKLIEHTYAGQPALVSSVEFFNFVTWSTPITISDVWTAPCDYLAIPNAAGTLAGRPIEWKNDWKLAEPSRGLIKFSATTWNDVIVMLGRPGDLVHSLIIYGWNGTSCAMTHKAPDQKDTQGPIIQSNGVSHPRPGEPVEFSIEVNHVNDMIRVIADGKVVLEKVVPNLDRNITHFALTSYDRHVAYANIESEKLVAEMTVPGLELEDGYTNQIAVASKNGKLSAYALDVDEPGTLMRYDAGSMADLPWEDLDVKTADGKMIDIRHFATSEDRLVVLSAEGKAYQLNNETKAFEPLVPGAGNEALDLDVIALGKKDELVAIDRESGNLFAWSATKGWELVLDSDLSFVAAGVDGTIMAIDQDGDVFAVNLTAKSATQVENLKLSMISVGDKKHMAGILHQGGVSRVFEYVDGAWKETGRGLKHLSINAAGTLFGVDADGDIYHRGSAGVALPKEAADIKANKASEVASQVVVEKESPRAAARKAGKLKKVSKALSKNTKAKRKAAKEQKPSVKERRAKAKAASNAQGEKRKKAAAKKPAVTKKAKKAKKLQLKKNKAKKAARKTAKKPAAKKAAVKK